MKMRCCLILLFCFCSLGVSGAEQSLKKERVKAIAIAKQQLLTQKERMNLINYIIAVRGYQKYLEIGTNRGDNFREIKAAYKTSVDPVYPSDFHMTSDEFFKINQDTFDIVFIDGLHLCEQVLRDVENSLKCLNPGGIIVMHDCLPVCPEHQYRFPVIGAWNGDVWKAAAYIRMHFADVRFCVVDMDWGCGIIEPDSPQSLYPVVPIEELDWEYYVRNREQLLNVVELGYFINTFR